jgi:hypothetical protein
MNALDLAHWTLNTCFGAFRTVWSPHVLVRFGPFHQHMKIDAKRAEVEQLVHKFVQRSRVGIFRNERTRSTPLDPKLIFWCVLDRFINA